MSTISLTTPPRVLTRRLWRSHQRSWIGYAFIAPNLIGFLLFTFLPLIFTLLIAFTHWDVVSGFSGIQWIGVQNFIDLWQDSNFWESARITLLYVGISVPVTTALGLLLALSLQGPVPGKALLRLFFFLPYIANVVAIAAVWILLYDPTYGPLNTFLRAVGLKDPPSWLAAPQSAVWAMIIIAIWVGTGYATIIYQAALQDLSQELYEAASLDGAGAWKRFRSITLPLLTPTHIFLLITSFIGVSQSFGLINVLTQGGPGRSTTILSYYIYQNGFQFYRFGYAAALTWVMFLVILVLTLLLWLFQWRHSIAD